VAESGECGFGLGWVGLMLGLHGDFEVVTSIPFVEESAQIRG